MYSWGPSLFTWNYHNMVNWLCEWSHSVMSHSLWPHGLLPTSLFHPWDFLGKNTRVGCHFLLQEIFPTQGLNLGLPHCRQTLYHLSHQGSLKCIQGGTRIWTGDLLICSQMFYHWAISPTNQAQPCLASKIRRDQAHSGWLYPNTKCF